MIIDRLKKLVKKREEKYMPIEILMYLDDAKIKLEKVKDAIKNEVKEYKKIRKIRPHLSENLDSIDLYIINESGKLYVIKNRLKELKEIIEKIEEIIIDAEGHSVEDEEEEEEECEPDAIDEEEEEECEEDY